MAKARTSFLHWIRSSIRNRLMLMMTVTTLLALLIAGAVMVAYDVRSYQASWEADLSTQAEILGRATAPALAFNDRSVALENLSLLSARPKITAGAVYTSQGTLFASYRRGNAEEAPIPQRPGELGVRREGNELVVFRELADRNEVIGTVYLRAQYELTERLLTFLMIIAGVIALSLLVAVWLSFWLQRAVTEPIESIASVAHRVQEQRDFSLRAERSTEDEIGYLADSFNGMLAELEHEMGERRGAERGLIAAQDALNKLNQRLQIALDAGELGDWNWDAATDGMTLGGRAARTVGLLPDVPYSRARIRQLLPPEDAERAREALDRALAERTDYGCEYRVNLSDNRQIWIAARGRGRYAEDGTVLGMTGVMQDVTRRKSEEQALREADTRKDEFLAILAHELRNPLAPLRTSLHILRIAENDKAMVQQARDVMDRQIRQLVRLVDDLLDISRISTGKLELKRERVSLLVIAERALESARPLLSARKQTLRVDLPVEPVPLDADPTRLAQVLINLLNNAGKFSPPGSEVALSAAIEGDMVAITVADQGIGIAPGMLSAIFQMFVQADSSLEREQAGLGVGLSLARHLVEMHGGSIGVASEGRGRGSRFTVRIPIAASAVAPQARAPAEARAPKVPSKRVLLADDNEDFAAGTAAILEMLGHDVRVAHDGAEALALAQAFKPEIAFLDIGLPRLNGYELARQLRQLPLAQRPFLVAVTGWGQDSDVQRSREAGFDLHLVKPVDFQRIEAILAAPPVL
jgi:signal transduction histidine kinase/HAMP domain-containing protein